jgi:hypothetical protein
MTCCGNLGHRAPSTRASPGQRANGPVLFEYEGPTPLTIFGRATGIRYHFPGPGARAQVDPRDAPILEITRGLKIVSRAAVKAH